MGGWRRWHERGFWRRTGSKLLLFALLVLLVLFPRVDRMLPWAARLAAIDRLIDADAPELAPLEAEVRRTLPPGAKPHVALAGVNAVVCAHVPYCWDWDRWGNADYWPTVSEALSGPGEDCDGRAVVAASLLRRLGYEAWLVCDLLHVWVGTPAGETMSPTSERRTLTGGAPGTSGTRASFNLDVLTNAIRGTCFGVGAFPSLRIMLLLAGVILLTLHPRVGWVRTVLAVLLIAGGYALLRSIGERTALYGAPQDVALALLAVLGALVGWVTLAVRGAGPRPRSSPAQPE